MVEISTCAGCGLPDAFTQINRWLYNGDIVQSTNEEARMAFVECENVDPVFRDIGRAIGAFIDHLVINIVARGTQPYMDDLVPEPVKELDRNETMDVRSFYRGSWTFDTPSATGSTSSFDYRYENDPEDYCKIRITLPFSILDTSRVFAGVIASTVGGEHSVTYEEVSSGVFELTTGWTTYPEVLKERLELTLYRPAQVDLELERCERCGIPLRLSETYIWYLEIRVITNQRTGYRMAVLGPGLMDTVFEGLKWELGEEIPRLAVDAQRRLTLEGFAPVNLTLGFRS